MVFPDVDNVPRTDEEYKNILDEDHHKGECSLSSLLPLVKRVPFNPMHLVHLGNVKKLFEANFEENSDAED